MKAQALYNFAAQPDSNELHLSAGDVINVVRQDVGDGWWEGVNERCERGLFPLSYVEVLDENGASAPPVAPPPPLPEVFRNLGVSGSSRNQNDRQSAQRDSWGDADAAYRSCTGAATHSASNAAGDFDDDWSDDDESQAGAEYGRRNDNQTVINSGLSADSASKAQAKDGKSAGTVKKSMNRFSPFVKSGTEGYLLNTVKLSSKPNETIEIILADNNPEWAPSDAYTCNISSHQKASKMHGLKSFIAYQLTPSINNLQVSRRYKHFDWLVCRLQEKFTVVFVPPLPEKQVTGRYEEEFVVHRMHLLQMWLNKVCRHPILSRSEVWIHFLTCTDEKEWKRGKRRAEKDEYSGGLLFYAIKTPPNMALDYLDVERQVDSFSRTCRFAEESVRNFQAVANDNVKRMVGPFQREFVRIGGAFRSLATNFESSPHGQKLSAAIQETAACYETMGRAYGEQPKLDWLPLLNEMFMHRGTLNNVPDVLQVHKSSCSKFRDSQRMMEEGRLSGPDLEGIRSRLDVISCATLAEINHFEKERAIDFNRIMKRFLDAQITFYQGFVEKLQGAARKFDD